MKKLIILFLCTLLVLMSGCGASGNKTVYITETGEKYHKGDCVWLYNSKEKISLEKAIDKGYEPCKVCEPPEK